ncbi:MAG: ATP-binding cassette domain-containing protein [Prevotellaceae bacterium]|jgi:cell division transport system ATP-binding protein|nr:ATP-binding cassette domain-containing protein [Prevotellaceae bacterium]
MNEDEKKLLIEYEDVTVSHQKVPVLEDVNIKIYEGEFVYLLGKVGSGKSSFLKSLYAELAIQSGEASILGYNLRRMSNKLTARLRRKTGIVFQDFQLLIDRNAHDNLEFVLRSTGWKRKTDIEEQIGDVLAKVGMAASGYRMPHQLSGGEQQRIVIARALLNSPKLILADEPTGNLDQETGQELVELLHQICRQSATTVVMATHNLNWTVKFPGRIFRCENEKLLEIQAE